MTQPADLFVNQLGHVLVVAPTREGRLRQFAEERNVVLDRGGERLKALARWIFADFPTRTLMDDWGNSYDHAVHTLIVGTLDEGRAFVEELSEQGFDARTEVGFFVPFQTIDPNDREGSDLLRVRHARAFAIARRETPSATDIITAFRDSVVVGEH